MPLGGNTSTTEQTTPSQTAETTSVVEKVAEEEEVLNIPDITLVVENGTGLPDANSYCDLDYAVEYCTMKGYTDWLKLSENQQKIFIIRGTEFVDNFYTWKGIRHRQSIFILITILEGYAFNSCNYILNGRLKLF